MMPHIYNAIIGPEINHIVTPLPSGVIAAPTITMATIAYLMLFLQNFASVNPDFERAYSMVMHQDS